MGRSLSFRSKMLSSSVYSRFFYVIVVVLHWIGVQTRTGFRKADQIIPTCYFHRVNRQLSYLRWLCSIGSPLSWLPYFSTVFFGLRFAFSLAWILLKCSVQLWLGLYLILQCLSFPCSVLAWFLYLSHLQLIWDSHIHTLSSHFPPMSR